MTMYAAYDDFSIYAIANSRIDAVTKARINTRQLDAEFETAQISAELAAQIETDGWNGNHRSFIVRNGYIIDTTRCRE